MKIDRMAVYNKFDGHCAYCGESIEFKKMQVDHFWPQFLKHHQKDLDNNRFENLMPSCHKCNNHKHGMKPEVWRSELKRQIEMLKKNAQFDRALRFGQIGVYDKPILFWYEIIQKAHAPQKTAEQAEIRRLA
jgi:hypothetical protein